MPQNLTEAIEAIEAIENLTFNNEAINLLRQAKYLLEAELEAQRAEEEAEWQAYMADEDAKKSFMA